MLADYSMRGHAGRVHAQGVWAYRHHQADRVVGESNNGGDYIGTLLHTVDPDVPYRKVTATRGKRVRAEPVSALYEQLRIHHVGVYPEHGRPDVRVGRPSDPESPDRVDALVLGRSRTHGPVDRVVADRVRDEAVRGVRHGFRGGLTRRARRAIPARSL